MDVHKNAHLTPRGRELMVRAVVDDGLSPAAKAPTVSQAPGGVWLGDERGREDRSRRPSTAARRFNTTPKIVAKWVERFRQHGAPHPGRDRRRTRPLAGHHQPYPQAPRTEPALLHRARRAPLQTRRTRRDHPYRHQETRSLQRDRTSHRITPSRRAGGVQTLSVLVRVAREHWRWADHARHPFDM
jgi:hypothetical protein